MTNFSGNLIAGIWGGKYETFGAAHLFGNLALISFTAFVLLLCFVPRLNESLKQ